MHLQVSFHEGTIHFPLKLQRCEQSSSQPLFFLSLNFLSSALLSNSFTALNFDLRSKRASANRECIITVSCSFLLPYSTFLKTVSPLLRSKALLLYAKHLLQFRLLHNLLKVSQCLSTRMPADVVLTKTSSTQDDTCSSGRFW